MSFGEETVSGVEHTFRLGLPAASSVVRVSLIAANALSAAPVMLPRLLLVDVMLNWLAVCVNSYQPDLIRQRAAAD